jgi:hypothetical protein
MPMSYPFFTGLAPVKGGMLAKSAVFVSFFWPESVDSVNIVGFFKAGVRQHGAAVSTGATLDQ